MANTSLKDIAKEASVSIKTASRVVNNLPNVSEKTRERVWKSVKKFGYFPSEEGRKLVSMRRNVRAKTNRIGCIFFHTYTKYTEPFFAELLEDIEHVLVEHNLHNFFTYSLSDFDNKGFFLRMVNPNYIDGCLLIGMGDIYKDKIKEIKERVEHLVIVSDHEKDSLVSAVYQDGQKAGYMATTHLLSLGHTRIACITGHLDWPGYPQLRLEGYKQALAKAHIPYNPKWVKEGKYSIEGAAEATNMLLRTDPRPSAIFVVSDQMAIGAYKAIQENNLRIPGDVSVIGCDNIEITSHLYPSLTTIAVEKKEMAQTAVRLLREEIAGDRTIPVQIIFPVKLVKRNSCGKVQG